MGTHTNIIIILSVFGIQHTIFNNTHLLQFTMAVNPNYIVLRTRQLILYSQHFTKCQVIVNIKLFLT